MTLQDHLIMYMHLQSLLHIPVAIEGHCFPGCFRMRTIVITNPCLYLQDQHVMGVRPAEDAGLSFFQTVLFCLSLPQQQWWDTHGYRAGHLVIYIPASDDASGHLILHVCVSIFFRFSFSHGAHRKEIVMDPTLS